MSRATYTYSCMWCGVQRKTRSGRLAEVCMDCRTQTQAYEIRVPEPQFWQAVREIRGW